MRRIVLPLGLVILGFGIASLASAQNATRPHMDLVRGLRKEGLTDLALQYLDSLKSGTLDPETQMLLDLEYARTWLDLAATETEEGKRTGLITQAKRKLEAFISANPKHPLTVQANIDLAKLYSVQGKTQIRKARRIENKPEREAGMKAAQPLLKAAGEKYKATAKLLDEQIKELESTKTPSNDKKRRDLLEFRLNAQLDEGITYYYLGETYIGDETKDVTEQGNQYKAAKKIFETIRYEDEKIPIRWVAMAWSAQADLRAGDAGSSEKTLDELKDNKKTWKKTPPAAIAGIRVARYFEILNNQDSKKDYVTLEKDTDSWLKDYPSQRDSAEGLGCRYYLAIARLRIGSAGLIFDKKMGKIVSITPAAKIKLDQAQRLFKDLADSENEFAERSSRNRSQILVTVADAEGHGDMPPVESLPNFEVAYLMAQVQIARFGQFVNKPPAKEDSKGKELSQEEIEKAEKKHKADIEKEEKRRLGQAIKYLERALKLASPPKDNIREIFAARLTLVQCYFALKMYPQAATLAEYLARENPKMSMAPRAGSTAVTAYNMAQIELKNLKERAGATDNDKTWEEGLKADSERLRRAADYVIKQWPNETVTDESRHILAFYALRDKKYDEAWKVYAGIHNGYPAVQAARLEMASAMFVLVLPADERDPAKFKQIVADRLKQYEKEWKETIALLESTPGPEDDSTPQDALAYLDNRAMLARLYSLEDSQDKVQTVTASMLREVNRFTKLNDQRRTDIKQTAENLALTSIRAQAQAEYAKGDHARVAELLNPQIEEIKKDFDKPAPAELTRGFEALRKTQRNTISLALQSCVRDGKIERAGELLDVLEKSGGGAEESLGMLQTLVGSVRGQIEELDAAVKKLQLEMKKDEAAVKAKEADTLKAGFSSLLEKLIARGDKLPMRMKLFLASGLGSVGSYEKAKDELEKIRKVAPAPMPASPGENATEEQLAKYKKEKEEFEEYEKYQRQAQYMLARNFRASKEYAKAVTAFNDMIFRGGPPAPPKSGPPPAVPKDKQNWGYVSLQVRKEKAQTLEDMAVNEKTTTDKLKRWGEAVQEWITVGRTFTPKLDALRKTLPPQDEARKILFLVVNPIYPRLPMPREEGEFCLLDLAWVGHQYGQHFVAERAKAADEAQKVAERRNRYFELYFEQKRCSVMAFKSLGVGAFSNNPNPSQALQEKFAGFAKSFVELQDKEKNPDLSQTIKDKIKELVESVPELKREYSLPVSPAGK